MEKASRNEQLESINKILEKILALPPDLFDVGTKALTQVLEYFKSKNMDSLLHNVSLKLAKMHMKKDEPEKFNSILYSLKEKYRTDGKDDPKKSA